MDEIEEQEVVTDKVYVEGEKIARFVDSDDWKFAKDRLMSLVRDADSIRGIDKETPKDMLLIEIEAKKMAVGMILGWIDDIEGIAQQHIDQDKMVAKEKESHILRQD